MDRIDRLNEANSEFSERFGLPKPDTASSKPETDELDFQVQKKLGNKHNEGGIVLSEYFELVKEKRSQGRNQVANSIKIYDRRTKTYISIALISNIVFDDKLPPVSAEVTKANRLQLDKLQVLFDDFLLSIHEKL